MLATALVALALAFAAPPHAFAQSTGTGTVTVKWHTQPLIHIQLFTNYNAGCGTVLATIGTQPTPHPGPDAVCGSTSTPVDFGTVQAGSSYLYKYATHLNVTSSDPSGCDVYGEGAADFFLSGTTSGTTMSVSSLYYLPSGATTDTNTGFSPSTPFLLTSNPVSGYNEATAPTITYGAYPAPIAVSSTANSDFYWDYQLKVPFAATTGKSYVWVVYTVVGR